MSSTDTDNDAVSSNPQDSFYEDLFDIKKPDLDRPISGQDDAEGIPAAVTDKDPDSAPVPVISEHESHCHSCVNFRQCRKKSLSACPIIPCRFKCAHQFHECKSAEHEEYICPKKPVPCLNVNYGCPMVLERRFTGTHLQTCPASVVVCTVEWNRKPLAPWQSAHYDSYASNHQHLDIAATKRDEQTVKEYYKLLPQSLRSLLKSNDKKQTIMPLGVAGTRIPNSILNQTVLEKLAMKVGVGIGTNNEGAAAGGAANAGAEFLDQEDVTGTDKDAESDDDDSSSLISYSEPSYGIRKSPSAGLQQSVCLQLVASTVTGTAEESQNSTTTTDKQPSQCKKSRVRLSPVVDVVVKDACKYMNLFTFMCAHEFRRDEISGHFQNVHTEIITQLNGWLFTRCPMANYGCNFGVERMFPCGSGSTQKQASNCLDKVMDMDDDAQYEIVHNEPLDSFCYRQSSRADQKDLTNGHVKLPDKTELNHDNTDIGNNTVPLNICDLPVEVLVHLTNYLDPLSLNALTLTNTLFLSICQMIVAERGIVVLDWEKREFTNESDNRKRGGGGWEVVEKRWMFSKYFTPIRKWRFMEPGLMSNHMAKCSYIEEQRNRPSKPFCYPVTKDNL